MPNQTLHTKEWHDMINDKTTTGICKIPFKYQISQRASQESKNKCVSQREWDRSIINDFISITEIQFCSLGYYTWSLITVKLFKAGLCGGGGTLSHILWGFNNWISCLKRNKGRRAALKWFTRQALLHVCAVMNYSRGKGHRNEWRHFI